MKFDDFLKRISLERRAEELLCFLAHRSVVEEGENEDDDPSSVPEKGPRKIEVESLRTGRREYSLLKSWFFYVFCTVGMILSSVGPNYLHNDFFAAKNVDELSFPWVLLYSVSLVPALIFCWMVIGFLRRFTRVLEISEKAIVVVSASETVSIPLEFIRYIEVGAGLGISYWTADAGETRFVETSIPWDPLMEDFIKWAKLQKIPITRSEPFTFGV